MPDRVATISVSCNNSQIEKLLLAYSYHSDVKFVAHSPSGNGYYLFIVDLESDLTNVSQSLINAYHRCREKNAKLVVTILHLSKIDSEKNHYFQRMLTDLGKDHPLHRLVLTKDLYQTEDRNPITPFDQYIYKSLSSAHLDISEKGENLLYPLSFKDFIYAIVKILFLQSTAGESFWLLGDPIKDLELAYLLKNNLQDPEKEFEINAVLPSDDQNNVLKNYSVKAKAELNWETDDDFSLDLKKIISLYHEDEPKIINEKSKSTLLTKLIHWVRDRRLPKKENKLPNLKSLLLKFFAIITCLYLCLGLVAVVSTLFSLKQLSISAKQIQEGNVQRSVRSLQYSTTMSSLGESTFSFVKPIVGMVAPFRTQKIFNLYSFINYTQTTLRNIQQTYNLADTLLVSLNNTEAKVDYGDISLALHSNLSQIYENLAQISYLSGNGRLPDLISPRLQNSSEYKNLNNLSGQVEQYIKVSDLLPYLSTSDNAKNVLFLLQNNQTLRPGGGEISYFLLVSLDQNKLVSQKFYTASDLESLYQSTPSASIKNRKTKTPERPNLRQISANPDFSIAAAQISQYIENSLKVKPDFVIGLNNTILERLLIEDHSDKFIAFQKEIVQGDKEERYKNLVSAYLDRIFTHQLSLSVIGKTLSFAVGDNQLYLWASDPTVEKVFSSQPYSGVIIPHPCFAGLSGGQSCISETSYLVEDQSPVTIQNPWSSREMTHSITFNGSTVTHEYQLTYKPNPAASQSANLDNLYHVYISSPSNLEQISLDNLPYSQKQATKEASLSLDHYRIPMQISSDQDHTVVFRLITSLSSTPSSNLSYSLTEYRQPGTVDLGAQLKINLPSSLRLSVITQPVKSEPSSFSLQLPPHTTTFGFTLVPNLQ